MFEHLKGLIAPPLTGYKKDGSINYDIIPEYAQYLKKNGLIGAFVNGTTGESLLLGLQERINLAKKWIDAAPSNFKIIIHIGHTSICDSKILAKNAQDIGAYAVASMAPPFFKPNTVEKLVDHCVQEAAACPNLPYYFYHIPSVSGVDVSMFEFIKQASKKIPNFVGMKFSDSDPYMFKLCLEYENKKYNMLWGSDENLYAVLVLGCEGAVGTHYNYAAPLFNQMIKENAAGNAKKAENIAYQSIRMVEAILRAGPFPSNVKTVMRFLGFDFGPVRSPMTEIKPENVLKLKEDLESLGFFDYCCKK